MASRSQKHKLCILVVDNDPHSREFLCDLLSRWHFHAISVANAWSVLEVLERNEIDLVLLDHSSPTMDKVDTETLEEITRYAPDLPVIIMGAPMTTALKRRLCERGAQGFLRKPVKRVTLAVALFPYARPSV